MSALRREIWLHPEWSAALIAAAAWPAVLAAPMRMDADMSTMRAPAFLFGWLLMAAAMMIPPALPTVRQVASTAPWRRRQRTVALFLGGYLAVWLLFGAVALSAISRLHELTGAGTTALAAGALIAGCAWQLTPWKRRALRACHLLAPLPPYGRAADRACASAGIRHATCCAGACWAVMLAAAAMTPAVYATMPLFTALLVLETRARRPDSILLATAATMLVVAVALATA